MTAEATRPEDASERAFFAVNRLSAGYGPLSVVRDVSFSVSQGEILGILGRNGAGKTTLMQAIAGYLENCAGQVTIDGHLLRGPAHTRQRAGLSIILEGRSVFPSLTVRENLSVARVDPDRVYASFPELEARGGVKAGMLSGGEQQMLALARALASEPKVLLLDELSFGLAPITCDRLLESLTTHVRGGKTAVVVVEQHLNYAEAICDRVLLLHEGTVQTEIAANEFPSRMLDIERVYLADPVV